MEEKARLGNHNAQYRQQFGFTFIICARENKAAAILAGLDRRSVVSWFMQQIDVLFVGWQTPERRKLTLLSEKLRK